jgi:hypothetical protein
MFFNEKTKSQWVLCGGTKSPAEKLCRVCLVDFVPIVCYVFVSVLGANSSNCHKSFLKSVITFWVGKGKGRKTLPVNNGCTKSIKRRLK